MHLETITRLSFFLGILAIMLALESIWPRRTSMQRTQRWPGNFSIVACNALLLAALPITAVQASVFAVSHQFGLLNVVEWSLGVKMIVTVLVLDLAIYWQHRVFHMTPMFWRIHRMHHSDTAIDTSTGLRFHPVEIVISILIKAGVIILLGAPILGVIAFEIILNGSAMFNHGNLRLPLWLDRILRSVLVTPDMHRVHHSILPQEHHRNFGFCVSLWDRIFASYCDQPTQGHNGMQIGLPVFRETKEARLDKMLTQPFRHSHKK